MAMLEWRSGEESNSLFPPATHKLILSVPLYWLQSHFTLQKTTVSMSTGARGPGREDCLILLAVGFTCGVLKVC